MKKSNVRVDWVAFKSPYPVTYRHGMIVISADRRGLFHLLFRVVEALLFGRSMIKMDLEF